MADYEGTGANIRRRFRDLEPAALDADPNKALAEYVSLAPATPLGHEKLTVSTSALPLPNLPENTRRVYITSLGQPLEFRDDGVTPDGTNGYPIPADTHFIYDNDVSEDFLLILASYATGDADVRIAYYG